MKKQTLMWLTIGLFCVYLITLVYVTLLTDQVLRLQESPTYRMQFNLSIFSYLTSDIESRNYVMKDIGGNLLLLFPFGLFVSFFYNYFIKRKVILFLAVAITGLLFSFLIELIQMLLAYRIFDINDIILNFLGNTAGSVIFIILYPLTIAKIK